MFFVTLFGAVSAQNPNFPKNEIKDLSKVDPASFDEAAAPQINITVSEYYGLEEKIMGLLLNKDDLKKAPKSIGYSDKTTYLKTLNTWLGNNKSLLKPENQNNIITE